MQTRLQWVCPDAVPEHQDEVVYYDAFESPDAMKGEEDPPTPPSPLKDEELSVLQLRTRQLEARRGRITAKKVYLKNKKVPPKPLQRALQICATVEHFIYVSFISNRKSVLSTTIRRYSSDKEAMMTAVLWRQRSR